MTSYTPHIEWTDHAHLLGRHDLVGPASVLALQSVIRAADQRRVACSSRCISFVVLTPYSNWCPPLVIHTTHPGGGDDRPSTDEETPILATAREQYTAPGFGPWHPPLSYAG